MDIGPQSLVHRCFWNLAVIVFVHKQQGTVHQVAQVSDKLAVHLFLEILPCELEVRLLGPVVEDVEPPCIGWNAGGNGIASEYAYSS